MSDEALDDASGDARRPVGAPPVVAERVRVEVGLQVLGCDRAGMRGDQWTSPFSVESDSERKQHEKASVGLDAIVDQQLGVAAGQVVLAGRVDAVWKDDTDMAEALPSRITFGP